MLAKAVAETLKKHPIVNAAYVEGGIKYNKGASSSQSLTPVSVPNPISTPTPDPRPCQDPLFNPAPYPHPWNTIEYWISV